MVLPITLEEAWDFFSRPQNLSEITPSDMGFTVTSHIPEHIYPGLIITYRITPLFSIPLRWVTEITHLKENTYFIDEQRSGPYKIWHHEHHFKAVDGGTEMEDLLFYQLPFGVIGRLIDRLLVYRRVKTIFDYREMILEKKYTPTFPLGKY